jgi:hypothetical protein
VLDVDLTFQERWEDRTPRDHRNPLRSMWRRLSHEPRRLGLLQRRLPPPTVGSHAVRVLRTYPARRRVIPFAPDGERRPPRADRPGAGWATGPACSPASCGCGCGASTWGRGQGDDADLLDPAGGFQAWQPTAAHLQAWYQGGRQGSRPPGRILARQAPLAPP